MAEKKTNTGGKRVAKNPKVAKVAETNTIKSTKKRSVVPAVIAVCAVVFIAAAYVGLCMWATSHVLPNSSVLGVELGGLSWDDAEERLATAVDTHLDKTIGLVYGDVRVECELGKAQPSVDFTSALEPLSLKSDSFLQRGVDWCNILINGERHEVNSAVLYFINQVYMDGLLTELTSTMSNPVEQHEVTIGETDIRVSMGHAGQAINTVTLEEKLLTKLTAKDYSDLTLEATITQPDPINFEALYSKIYIGPVNSALDSESYEIIPHVTGVSFDLGVARNRYVAAKENETFSVPLVFTEPEITTTIMEESLFADVLGEAKSWVSGTNNRLANVILAGELVHDTILLPGDEFSYWSKIAPCTEAQGFKPAPSYLNGQTVDSIGGGICQMSSSIYTASLYSNLEIVQRNQHTYAVGYLPDGCDAMVNGGSSDYKFKNNTKWPIKIVVKLSGRNLTVQILGTKTDDTYVKLEFTESERTAYSTVYKIDDTIPVGTTKEEANGYTGRKTETYRCVYAGDGTLISRTFENKNNYRMRNEVILINSADAYKYGVDPMTGEKLPEGTVVTPAPTPTTTPEATPPDPNAMPDWLGGGTSTQAPEISPEPTPTPVEEMPDWIKPIGSEESDT